MSGSKICEMFFKEKPSLEAFTKSLEDIAVK